MAVYRTPVGALSFKQETTEGTAETSSLAQTVMAMNVEFESDIGMYQRPIVADTYGTFAAVPGAKMGRIKFECAAVGAASAANLGSNGAELSKFYGAADFKEVLVASTSATYTPEVTADSTMKSLTIRQYIDGLYWVIRGARVETMSILGNVGEPIRFVFTIVGAFDHEQGEGSTPAATSYIAVLPAPLLSAALAVHGTSLTVTSFQIDINMGTTLRQHINGADGYLSARTTQCTVSGNITFEPELVATFDTYSKIEDGTEGAFTVTNNGATANKLTITSSKIQLVNVRHANTANLLKYNANFQMNRSSGDDSITLAWT